MKKKKTSAKRRRKAETITAKENKQNEKISTDYIEISDNYSKVMILQ